MATVLESAGGVVDAAAFFVAIFVAGKAFEVGEAISVSVGVGVEEATADSNARVMADSVISRTRFDSSMLEEGATVSHSTESSRVIQ